MIDAQRSQAGGQWIVSTQLKRWFDGHLPASGGFDSLAGFL